MAYTKVYGGSVLLVYVYGNAPLVIFTWSVKLQFNLNCVPLQNTFTLRVTRDDNKLNTRESLTQVISYTRACSLLTRGLVCFNTSQDSIYRRGEQSLFMYVTYQLSHIFKKLHFMSFLQDSRDNYSSLQRFLLSYRFYY